MSSREITNVNLQWQRKARGSSAIGRYALANDGSLLVSVPDELEARTFHIARFDVQGRSKVLETFSVEILRKTEIAATGECFIGRTDDDLYMFRERRKSRFLTDRHASYTDIALSESGQRFAAAFCDMLMSGNALALGDITGRLLWTKDISFPVARVAVDREARHIAVAGENGDLLLLDASRTTLLTHRQEARMTAVATLGPRRTVFAGGGGVGAIDEEGALLWFTEIQGDLIEVAMDDAGRTTAVLSCLDQGSGRLVFLSPDGMPMWDVDFDDTRPTGLALSADGTRAAVSLRDGSLAVYVLEYGERMASASSESVLAEAALARETGHGRQAAEMLRARLAAVPSDVEACVALKRTLDEIHERCLSGARTAEAVGDYAAADNQLQEAVSAAPLDAEAVAYRAELRARWAAAARAAADAALAAGDGATAEERYLEAIHADPLDREARGALAAARFTASAAAVTRAREQLAAGRFDEAIVSLTEAQSRGASGPEVTPLLREARIGEALALGNRLYQDRQYAAALFQFKKVLRFDPDNAEAWQKIGYAQNFLQDTQLSDRFTRLE